MTEQVSEIQSVLRFSDYTVNRVEFETNPDFSAETVDINFSINHMVGYQAPDADVTLNVIIFPNARENNYPFHMEISVTGRFQIEGIKSDEVDMLLNNNAIAILFPYLRAIVSTYTANANIPPLILPPINVVNLLNASRQQDKTDH